MEKKSDTTKDMEEKYKGQVTALKARMDKEIDCHRQEKEGLERKIETLK